MRLAPEQFQSLYEALNDVSEGIAAINQMVSEQALTGVHVVSDSWGLCEPLMSSSS